MRLAPLRRRLTAAQKARRQRRADVILDALIRLEEPSGLLRGIRRALKRWIKRHPGLVMTGTPSTSDRIIVTCET